MVKVADAGVIFSNGAGLEEFLQPLLKNAGSKAEVFPVSENIQLLDAQGPHASDHPGGDPHTWFDPNNVIAWTQVIEQKLSALDPANAHTYAANVEDSLSHSFQHITLSFQNVLIAAHHNR